jgi:predicted dinucleotide-binding enzyme
VSTEAAAALRPTGTAGPTSPIGPVRTGGGAEVGLVGIIGAGGRGAAVGRLALAAGYRVLVGVDEEPATAELLVGAVAPGAEPTTPAGAAAQAELVVLALPLSQYLHLDRRALRGKVVLDATNHDPRTEGRIPALAHAASSSGMLQQFLRSARVVKTLNHIPYADLEADSALLHPRRRRRALAVAGDDAGARAVATRFVHRLGFDTVQIGSLTGAIALGPDSAVASEWFDRERLASHLRSVLARLPYPPSVSLRDPVPA